MYESSFGKILGHVTDKKEQPLRGTNGTKVAKKSNKTTSSPSPRTESPIATPPANQTRHKKKTSTTPSLPPTPAKVTESPAITNINNHSSSSHEEDASVSSGSNNNKKRKLMMETEPDEKSDDSAARKKASDREARRKRREAVVEEEEVKAGVHSQIVNLAKKKNKGEDVIRVPMLTGTLLLYRGPHRRAEFIYKK